MLKQPHNMEGMTYLEIIVCFFVVALLVLPLSASFLSATRMREEGVTLSQSTFQTERLMEEIKEQLRKDSLTAYQLKMMGKTGDYPYYFNPTISDKTTKQTLSVFFGGTPQASEYISKTYQIERYDYEVAIWPLKEQVGSTTISALSTQEDNCKAFRLYTATDATLAFKYVPEEESQLPQLNIASSATLFLITEPYLYTTDLGDASLNLSPIKGMATILLKQPLPNPSPIAEVDSVTYQNLIVTQSNLSVGSSNQGYSFAIQSTATTGTNMVIIDTRLIQNFSNVTTTNIKIKNESPLPLLVKLVAEEDKTKAEKDRWTDVESTISLIIEDSSINGKTSVEKVFSTPTQEGYLISIVVRDKEPKLGQSGKIVKTMMDLFTFEPADH